MKGGIGHEEAQMEKEDPLSNRLGLGCISTPPGRQVMVQGSEGCPPFPNYHGLGDNREAGTQ